MVKHVTSAEFESLLTEASVPVVCDFWAAWCMPCRLLAPAFESLANEYDGKAIFVKIDVDENEEAARKYRVASIPNVTVFKGGVPAATHLGFVPEQVLKSFIENNL